jgi:SAM-dependent methyltransferase
LLSQNRIPLNGTASMVDFGTAWGRIARFFFRDVDPRRIIGLDADPTVPKQAPGLGLPLQIRVVEPLGPTDIPDSSIDFVTGYSVFSHLDELAANTWIAEFHRILKPGGLLIATTHGESFIDLCEQFAAKTELENARQKRLASALPDFGAARRAYLSGQFVATEAYMPHYGEAMIPPGWLCREWGERFELLEFSQAAQSCWQAAFALRKR